MRFLDSAKIQVIHEDEKGHPAYLDGTVFDHDDSGLIVRANDQSGFQFITFIPMSRIYEVRFLMDAERKP
jgi:hypothetical protein